MTDSLVTVRILFERTGENSTTSADPVRVFVEGKDEPLLEVQKTFCLSSDDDRLVGGNRYEAHDVVLPAWLSGNEWARSCVKWKYTWLTGVDATWPEVWQRALADMNVSHRLAVVKLLKVKNFRSAFRKSLRDQIVAWMETPVEGRKYRSPLSARQWESLVDVYTAREAHYIEERGYGRRGIMLGVPVAA
jgi:hypothetical protein